MSDHDSFEDRVRAMAEQISRSLERVSEVDLEELAEKYGVDAERARTVANAAGQWLADRLSNAEPLFGQDRRTERDPAPRDAAASSDVPDTADSAAELGATRVGPHPLDLPTTAQGLALSALESGRWAVRPGSNQLASDEGPAPSLAPDLVSDLRARDWITTDGTLTMVGRHALGRWLSATGEPAGPDAPLS